MEPVAQPLSLSKVPVEPGMSQVSQTKAEVQQLALAIEGLDAKINVLLENSERARKSASRSMWLTIIFVILPLALSLIALPFFMKTLLGSMGLGAETSSIDVGSLLKQLQAAQTVAE